MKNIEEYSYNLVKDFIIEFPVLVKAMKDSEHGDIPGGIIPEYHLGESVWTHTLMVYSHMISELKDSQVNTNERELLIAALLHDIGKPQARFFNEKKNKYVFYNHDSISTFIALEIIQKIDPTITEDQKIYILKLINYHQILFDVTSDMSDKAAEKLTNKFDDEKLFQDLMLLRYCDFSGNISRKTQSTSWDSTLEVMKLIEPKIPIDPEKPLCTLLVGLPGSGKSTYIKENFKDEKVLSRDNLVISLSGKLNYNIAFNLVDHKVVDEMHEKMFTYYLKSKKDFVIDRTNLTHKGRMKFINRLTKAGFNVKIIILLPNMLTVIDRNAQRSINEDKHIPLEVIKNMMKNFNIPFANEGEVEYVF